MSTPWIDDRQISVAALLETEAGRAKLAAERDVSRAAAGGRTKKPKRGPSPFSKRKLEIWDVAA